MPSKPLNVKVDFRPLEKMQRENPEAWQKALEISAIQFLTWANTGAGGTKESRKPPIRHGVLRGSSSAFVNGKHVYTYPMQIKPGAEEGPTPATTGGNQNTSIEWVWNTDYANKMHEWKGGWGQFTTQDGDAGNKWAEMHVKADKELWLDVVGKEFKKEVGL